MRNIYMYVVNGFGGVGKNTFVEYLFEINEDKLHFSSMPFFEISSVDIIKEVAKSLGWKGLKTQEDRKFLSDLKNLADSYSDHSYTYIYEEVSKISKDNFGKKCVVFVYIREPDNIQRVVDYFGAKTILVENENINNNFDNRSDTSVYEYSYDFVIKNNGTFSQLKEMAKRFYHEEIENEI